MNTDGSGVVRLTSNSALDAAPSWSPDGQRIAFHSDRNGRFEIFIMNPQGGDQVRRTFPGDTESQPRWSPDGNQLTFVTSLGINDEVCTGSTSSGGATNLSQNDAKDSRPDWR
jgi:Tol biopolymer transport system component